jgi:hypothetical protein
MKVITIMKSKMLCLSFLSAMAAAMFATGCSSTNTQQFTDSFSGKGAVTDLSVPIPGTSYSIGLKCGIGSFNHTYAEQPVSTNHLHSAPMQVAAYGHGKQTVAANSGNTNGANATVGQGTSDASVITFGDMIASNQMGTNELLKVDGTGD